MNVFTRIYSWLVSQLNVTLSTRNAEVTQGLIKAKTDNLDIALSSIPTNRASQKTGRTHLQLTGIITGSGLIYTVTVGKVFYVTALKLAGRSTTAVATSYSIRNGGAGGYYERDK